MKSFLKKFKSFLRRTGIINYGDKLHVAGPNSHVLKKLLQVLGRQINVKFTGKGRKIDSYSIETYCVKGLVHFMDGKKFRNTSPLSCFTQKEINNFAEKEGIKTKELSFSGKEQQVYEMLKNLTRYRPGIFYSTSRMLERIMQ